MRSPKLYLFTLCVLIVLAGCSDSNNTTEAYCDSAANLASLETLLAPDQVDDPQEIGNAFESFASSLSDLEKLAPSEISGDIGQLGTAVDEVIVVLAAVEFDITQLDDDSAARLLSPFTAPATQRALARVDAFDTLNCSSSSRVTATTPPSPTTSSEASSTVPPLPTADPVVALAAEYANLIRTTFNDDEITSMLNYAEVSGVDELVDAIVMRKLTIDELDLFLQRSADGVPFAFGDDIDLDILWNACATKDWAACDGLFIGAPLNSLYQRFAGTCGQVLETSVEGQCVAEFAE